MKETFSSILGCYFFFDEKSSFGSLMSVIDPEGDIWLGPFNYTILVPWTASGEGTFFLYNI